MNDEQASTELQCSVCVDRGTLIDHCTFEYFPLLPRVQKWVLDETACRALFEYRHEHCTNRDASMLDGQQLFEDYFDGALYRELVESLGGESEVAFDIFLVPSYDGFQTYENNTYDCWPIYALNHNLHPDRRFALKNLIPFGFVKGPKEPVLLDTFFQPLVEEIAEINAGGESLMRFFDGSMRKVRVHAL